MASLFLIASYEHEKEDITKGTMMDEETYNAIHALHIVFSEPRDDFSAPLDEPAEIETAWPNSVRGDVMIAVALMIVYSSLHNSIARLRQKYFAPTIKRHPRRRLSNDEGI